MHAVSKFWLSVVQHNSIFMLPLKRCIDIISSELYYFPFNHSFFSFMEIGVYTGIVMHPFINKAIETKEPWINAYLETN